MNFSKFFISRPIFAAVLSLLILIAGAISLFQLPISEYPEVVPPTVVVRANFPGANPKVIGETVAAPLEQAITGVENMLYMSSQSTADGKLTLTITFALGTDLDNAQVQVQNRVTRTQPKLPEEVTRIGITVDKASPDLTMVVHITSPDQRYNMLYLSNYAILNIKDELARLGGVGDVQLFGMGDYSLRVWLDPNKTASRNLTATDVVTAIREQNRQVAAGALGAQPAPNDTSFQLSVNTQGRLVTEEEFENIVIRAGANGEITRLKDIARVELGSSQYALRSLIDNQPAVAIPIFQRPGSNAIDISNEVRAKMAELKQSFPEGMDYRIAYDPTVFVRGSIEAVVHTLFEALILVVLVLQLGDVIALGGSLDALTDHMGLIGPEVPDARALNIPLDEAVILVTHKDAVGRALKEFSQSPIAGQVQLVGIERGGAPIPVGLETRLQRLDVMHLIGLRSAIDKATALLGKAGRASTATDLLTLSLGMVLGLLIGLIQVPAFGAAVGLGNAGGLLVSGIIVSSLVSRVRFFGNTPNAARNILEDMGLIFFVAIVGVNAGANLVSQISAIIALKIFLLGFVACTIPPFIVWAVGFHVFKINPAILMGGVAGARSHSGPAREAAKEIDSTVPWIGFPVAYAVSGILLTVFGYFAMVLAR